MRRFLLLVTAGCALGACSQTQDQYWRRSDAPTYQYLSGLQAQEMLETALIECKAGMTKANEIESPRMVKRYHYAANPDQPRNADTSPTNEGGQGYYTRAGGETDKEADAAILDICMRSRGWERVNWYN